MTISVKLPPNSGHLLITDKFFKTCRCPLFRGFTVLRWMICNTLNDLYLLRWMCFNYGECYEPCWMICTVVEWFERFNDIFSWKISRKIVPGFFFPLKIPKMNTVPSITPPPPLFATNTALLFLPLKSKKWKKRLHLFFLYKHIQAEIS